MPNFQPAKPIDRRLLIGIAGPSGSGKTVSALRLATGLVSGTNKKVAFIDTENKRALEYVKDYVFDHCDFQPPFKPSRYAEFINEADALGYGAIIIDSMSHEHEGPGGVLDWHSQELDRMAGDDYGKRERCSQAAWIKPKAQRNALIHFCLQRTKAHIILCFRAKEKTEQKKVDGKTKIGKSGLLPIGGMDFFHEMSITMILPQGSAGHPDWESEASRINEVGGELKQFIFSHPQINEEMGAGIKQICSAKNKDPEKFLPRYRSREGVKFCDDILQWENAIKALLNSIKTVESCYKFIELNEPYMKEAANNGFVKEHDRIADYYNDIIFNLKKEKTNDSQNLYSAEQKNESENASAGE